MQVYVEEITMKQLAALDCTFRPVLKKIQSLLAGGVIKIKIKIRRAQKDEW